MPEQHDIPEMTKEFVATLLTYLKQRGAAIVSAVLVEPARKLALKVGLGCAGMAFVSLGVVFFGIFMVQGFTRVFYGDELYGYLASAVVVLLAGAALLWFMGRRGKEGVKQDDEDPE